MSDSDWKAIPLWRELCCFLDTSPQSDAGQPLELYERLEDLILKQDRGSEFVSTLTLSQYNSFQIIQEWWSCSIEEERWFANNKDKRKQLEVLHNFTLVENVSPLVLQILLGIEPPFPQFSTYRLQIHRLFQMEFDPQEWDGEEEGAFLGFLQQQRERSAFYASIQRTTFSLRISHQPQHPQCGPGGASAPKPQALIPKRPLSACIEACPWQRFRPGRSGYPFYLWDSRNRRTVVVSDLEYAPEYVCVSHTWGRWRERDKPNASIPGVPWLVPQNSRFQVEALPARLEAALLGRYIWLDLLCIPQDRSERALIEIARQASIFGNATIVVCWLNDIDDWTGTRMAIEWLASFCLGSYGDADNEPPSETGNISTGLALVNGMPGVDEARTPGFWFTSLWTLQEACLRPDMLLYNRDFEPLIIGDSHSITLDGLIALLTFVVGFYQQGPYETIVNQDALPDTLKVGTVLEFGDLNRPGSKRRRRILPQLPADAKGVLEIYDVLVMSGMIHLFSLSPASILYLGHHRKCTSNRAEAIMSVIGATDWYTQHLEKNKTSPSQDDLVLGYYPLAFLRETASLLGAKFFASVSSTSATLESVIDLNDGQWIPKAFAGGVGSLLPFTSSQAIMLPQQHDSTSTRDHPSIHTWCILPGGEVEIQHAAIISSSTQSYASELLAAIRVPELFSTGIQEQSDLHEWIRTFRVGAFAHNFAVSVYQPTKKFHWGVILKQVGAANRLVKIGTFFTAAMTIDDVQSEEVGWIVL